MKNLIIKGTLFVLALTTMAFTTLKNLPTEQAGGKVIIIVSIEVKNFQEWKKGFDAGATVREKAGIKVLSVCSLVDNENHVVVIEEAESAKAANDFLLVLKSKQKEGDMSKLDVKIYDKTE